MQEKLVTINNLTKSYDSKIILSNINMDIYKGQSIALVGHNGSGKSTFLKLISGLTASDSGTITYSHKLKFNYIPEHFPKMNITARKYISLVGQIEGLKSNYLKQKGAELFQHFFMEQMIDTPMKFLSKGTLQKVGVVQALLTEPDILMLDEPLSGQDLDSQMVFISQIKKLIEKKVTVIMSCHEPFLVDCLSDNLYEIKDTHIKSMKMKESKQENLDQLVFFNPFNQKKVEEELVSMMLNIGYIGDTIEIKVDSDKSNFVILKMIEEGYTLRGMNNA